MKTKILYHVEGRLCYQNISIYFENEELAKQYLENLYDKWRVFWELTEQDSFYEYYLDDDKIIDSWHNPKICVEIVPKEINVFEPVREDKLEN